jgi:hypothetical protein
MNVCVKQMHQDHVQIEPLLSTFNARPLSSICMRGNDPRGPQVSNITNTRKINTPSGYLQHGTVSGSITPPTVGRGQLTVLDEFGKWYYGAYGHREASHLRSFNRVLYR